MSRALLIALALLVSACGCRESAQPAPGAPRAGGAMSKEEARDRLARAKIRRAAEMTRVRPDAGAPPKGP